MEYLSIRNLAKYQRYTKRRPPWVKLYQTMLEDDALMRLSVTDRWVAVGLLLLASRTGNRIVNDPEFLQHALHLPSPVDVTALVGIGYLVDADAVTDAHHLHTKRVQRVRKTGAARTPNAHPKSTENREQRAEKETAPAAVQEKPDNWYGVVAQAYEAKNGEGSFQYGKHSAQLKPLKAAGKDAAEVAAKLTAYLAQTKAQFLSLPKFVETYAQWRDWSKEPMTDEWGHWTPAYHEWMAAGCP